MGNVCMGGNGNDDGYDNSYAAAARSSSSGSGGGGGGGGHRLGGNEVPEHLTPAEAAARAAERRLQTGPDAVIAERRRKEELIAKISEAYARKGQSAPIGLPSLSVDKLREIWSQIQSK